MGLDSSTKQTRPGSSLYTPYLGAILFVAILIVILQ